MAAQKKTVLAVGAITVLINMTLTNCNTPAPKTENAQNISADTNKTSDSTKYLQDMETYKQKMADTITTIDKKIDEFKTKLEKGGKQATAQYKKDIADLKQKGQELRRKLDEYQAKGKDKWEEFKTDFDRDMDTLSRQFKDLTSKKTSA